MLTVMFSCKGCGLEKQKVQVPARTTEDVVAWVHKVGEWVGAEHAKISPHCKVGVCDLYLPTPDDAEFIGQQIE